MQQPIATTFGSTKFCWICGRPISVETRKIDEHGNAAHEECYATRLNLENGAQGNGASFRTWKQQFREDCERHEKLNAFAILGDSVLKLLWESGVAPTVKAVVEGVREDKPN